MRRRVHLRQRVRHLQRSLKVAVVQIRSHREFDAAGHLVRTTVEAEEGGTWTATDRFEQEFDAAGHLLSRAAFAIKTGKTNTESWKYDAKGDVIEHGSPFEGKMLREVNEYSCFAD